MKIEVGSYEAKTKLPELLRQVEAGQSFTITNRGRPIADLVPSTAGNPIDRARAVAAMKDFMAVQSPGNVDIKALIEEGRR